MALAQVLDLSCERNDFIKALDVLINSVNLRISGSVDRLQNYQYLWNGESLLLALQEAVPVQKTRFSLVRKL